MIFQRATRREFTQSAAGVFVALFAILLTTQLIRLLSEAASGAVAPEAVVALLGFSALHYIPALLSLSAFVAILLSLGLAVTAEKRTERCLHLSCLLLSSTASGTSCGPILAQPRCDARASAKSRRARAR